MLLMVMLCVHCILSMEGYCLSFKLAVTGDTNRTNLAACPLQVGICSDVQLHGVSVLLQFKYHLTMWILGDRSVSWLCGRR